ncbi:hypothetical protein SAMN05421593_1473 [Chryseobacterium culicis]|uniref:Uncharacterized protein n=1 Tax=Chryseobacterium culicis TaxID=680127 RepID=A0A1H6H7R8_CHRCI|nr:hypothetical protein SAMN05421593_1473 [Chryseobacterium culicis]
MLWVGSVFITRMLPPGHKIYDQESKKTYKKQKV